MSISRITVVVTLMAVSAFIWRNRSSQAENHQEPVDEGTSIEDSNIWHTTAFMIEDAETVPRRLQIEKANSPHSALACLLEGKEHELVGRYAQAVKSYKHAIDRNPGDWEPYFRIGVLTSEPTYVPDLYSPSLALQYSEQAINRVPQEDRAKALGLRADIHYRNEELEMATRLYQEAADAADEGEFKNWLLLRSKMAEAMQDDRFAAVRALVFDD